MHATSLPYMLIVSHAPGKLLSFPSCLLLSLSAHCALCPVYLSSVRAQPALLHNMPRRGFSSSCQYHHHSASSIVSYPRSHAHTLCLCLFLCVDPEHIVLTMPALSPTMERGNIAAWKKKVGDHVKPGEALADIETDKATVAFESVEEGYIAKILIPEKSQDIPVGKPVAILAESKDSIDKFKDYAADGGAPAAATPAAASTPAASQPAAPAAAAATPAASTAAPSGRIIAVCLRALHFASY